MIARKLMRSNLWTVFCLLCVSAAAAAPSVEVVTVLLSGKGRAVELQRGPCTQGSCSLRLVLKEGGKQRDRMDLSSARELTVYDGAVSPLDMSDREPPPDPGQKTVSVAPLKQDPEEGGAVIVMVLPVRWAPGVDGFLLELMSMVAAEGIPTSEFAGVAVKDGKLLPLWRGNSYDMADEDFLTSVSYKKRGGKEGASEVAFSLTKEDKPAPHGVLRWDAKAGKLAFAGR